MKKLELKIFLRYVIKFVLATFFANGATIIFAGYFEATLGYGVLCFVAEYTVFTLLSISLFCLAGFEKRRELAVIIGIYTVLTVICCIYTILMPSDFSIIMEWLCLFVYMLTTLADNIQAYIGILEKPLPAIVLSLIISQYPTALLLVGIRARAKIISLKSKKQDK